MRPTGIILGVALLLGGVGLAAILHDPPPPKGAIGERLSVALDLPPTRGLDPRISYSRNSLGLRGREPPSPWEGALTIVVLGDDFAECRFLDDRKTWPAVLEQRLAETFDGVWVGAAARRGISSFGEARLLEGPLAELRPKYALLLLGASDIGRRDASADDLRLDGVPASGSGGLAAMLASQLAGTERLAAEELAALDLTKQPKGAIDAQRLQRTLAEHVTAHLSGFEARLGRLIELARARGIEPVLVTEPALYGDAADPTSGLDLGPMLVDGLPAAERWQLLDLYDGAIRRVGEANEVLVVDLARRTPKDSRIFYDWTHLTNEGAAHAAAVIAAELRPWLAGRGHRARR